MRDLVHGAIFTRGPKDLHNTAIFIGGTDMAAGERLLGAVKKAFFGPMRVSVMLDSNGSNTTAVAAVAKMQQAPATSTGARAVVTRRLGPGGLRAAGLLAKAGARRDGHVAASRGRPPARRDSASGSAARCAKSRWPTLRRRAALEGAEMFLNAGPAGVCLVPRDAWVGRPGLQVAVDVNAVPPLGVEGIEVTDDGAIERGVTTFGALGVGNLKMKIHKACIAKLFEKNDLVLDAETDRRIGEAL